MYLINRNKGYKINYLGHVVNASNNKIIKQRIDRAGYITVRLTQNGNTTTHFLHRLIAETFVPNTDNKPFVNHINGIKTDNRIENLEWVTHSENIKHAYSSQLIKNKGKAVFDKCCNKKFIDSREAAKFYGINHNTLRGYLNGQIKRNNCFEYISN
jgi:hypothetical protein